MHSQVQTWFFLIIKPRFYIIYTWKFCTWQNQIFSRNINFCLHCCCVFAWYIYFSLIIHWHASNLKNVIVLLNANERYSTFSQWIIYHLTFFIWWNDYLNLISIVRLFILFIARPLLTDFFSQLIIIILYVALIY